MGKIKIEFEKKYRIAECVCKNGKSFFKTEYESFQKGNKIPGKDYSTPDSISWIVFGDDCKTKKDAETQIVNHENNKIKKVIYHLFN